MEMLVSFWKVLAMMAPWLLAGFLLAGVVSVLLPREWVVKAMGRAKGWKGVLNAVLIGVPLPICSCGVLPLTTGLRKAGAGKGAIAGFLISTPQTGIDSVLATYALMGPVFAVARPLAAFATGMVGGAAVAVVTRTDEEKAPEKPSAPGTCHCCCHHQHAEPKELTCCETKPQGNLVLRILRAGFGELLGEIARPLAFGLIVSAVVTVCVPADFFATAFGGNDWLAMPAMVLIGFPMYVCSTASIPIAASLLAKGLTPGAAFVFLMVGPAINAASLATVSKLIGGRATVVYTLIIAVGAIVCGLVVNALPISMLTNLPIVDSHEGVSMMQHLAAGVLVLLVLAGMFGKRRQSCCSRESCCHD